VIPLQYDATTYMNLLRQLERHFGGEDSDLAISATALIHGKKIDLRKKALVTEVAAKLQAHRELLRVYGKDKTEFAKSSQLYKDLIRERMDDDAHRDFQKYRQDNKLDRSPQSIILWLDGLQTLLEDMESCTSKATQGVAKESSQTKTLLLATQVAPGSGGEGAEDSDGEDEGIVMEYLDQDVDDNVVAHILFTAQQTGTPAKAVPPCDWKGNPCKENHFLKDCPVFVKMTEVMQ
jgi:hypothetical protein